MSRLKMVGWVVAAVMVLAASNAFAQRDAAAKARGEFGKGFWNAKYKRSTGIFSRPRRSTSPSTATSNSYPVYSYAPEGYLEGNTVSVIEEDTKLMRGKEVLASLKKGQDLTVLKTMNGWLGTATKVEGQTLKGWVWHKNVQAVPISAAPPASETSATTDIRTYRRFSYQPTLLPPRNGRAVETSRKRRPPPPYVRQHPGSWGY